MNQQKQDILFGKDKNKFTNPKWTAKYGATFAVILIVLDLLLLLIFRDLYFAHTYIYGLAPLLLGILGTYFCLKQKAGTKWITLNILVILLGILSLIAPAIFVTLLGL